jgi:hypothetical protein
LYRTPPKFGKGIKILKRSAVFPLAQLYSSDEMYLRHPLFRRGRGPFLYDYDDNRFVDFDLSGGSLLLGHAPHRITSSIKGWLGRGFASGYLSSAHRNLSQMMLGTLMTDYDGAGWEKADFLYYDSACEAVMAFLELLPLIGLGDKALVVLSDADGEGKPQNVPLYFRNLKTVDLASFSDLSLESIDFVFIRFGKNTEERTAKKVIKEIKKREIPIFADAVDFESYVLIFHAVNWTEDLDAVIFGNWVASGLSFGSVILRKSLINKLPQPGKDDHRTNQMIDLIASLSGFPPTFKLKAAQKSLSLLRKLGGIKAILEKGNHFFSMLNDACFQNHHGIVYVKGSEHLTGDYGRLRTDFMRIGLYFPANPWVPVAVSMAHDTELLQSCASKINSLFDRLHH